MFIDCPMSRSSIFLIYAETVEGRRYGPLTAANLNPIKA